MLSLQCVAQRRHWNPVAEFNGLQSPGRERQALEGRKGEARRSDGRKDSVLDESVTRCSDRQFARHSSTSRSLCFL
jgi:hypothetical protein